MADTSSMSMSHLAKTFLSQVIRRGDYRGVWG